MNITKLLNNLIKKLNPDRTREDRIKDKVFARLNLETPQRKLNLFDLSFMNKKFIFGTLSFAAVGVFIGLPIIMGALNSTGYGTGSLSSLSVTKDKTVLRETTTDENKNYVSTPSANYQDAVTDAVSEIFGKNEEEDIDTKESERAKEKWAELYLRVGNVSETISKIYELTGTIEGYVVSSDYSTSTNAGTGTITIRVPSAKFDYTIKELRGYSVEVLNESTNIVDIQNEITANENALTELRKQLADEYTKLAAAKETEKPSIQSRINQLENEIKIYEDEANQLEQRASFSTIELKLTQEVEELGNDLKDVFTKALEIAKTILEFWARIAIWGVMILPPVALPILAFFAVKALRKWIKNRKK